MNNYLFRGKREDNGEWVVGYYVEHNGKPYIYFEEADEMCQTGNWLDRVEVIPETVGMWSWQADITGKRVFEGDIIRKNDYIGVVRLGHYHFDGAGHIGFYVEWRLGHGYTYLRKDIIFWIKEGAEVIGNIHDNPELLEGEA